ncbi:hypothetical protein BDK51DRAFT_28267 [Blyttiomyces helicus]|uniref:Uncharacterized protein n=1 Tax=Blyttiomyces helicus TaxID=388810 RepID=A0A4P9WBA6_9FUNG|nr:hypothetical protein BDK51DRAFT_28267 [Blyttiomyces helicus]|eukprot:RKO88438.1 hypothetical protein BDK51DRAFT_28267 [Blyttiomyces helicus]
MSPSLFLLKPVPILPVIAAALEAVEPNREIEAEAVVQKAFPIDTLPILPIRRNDYACNYYDTDDDQDLRAAFRQARPARDPCPEEEDEVEILYVGGEEKDSFDFEKRIEEDCWAEDIESVSVVPVVADAEATLAPATCIPDEAPFAEHILSVLAATVEALGSEVEAIVVRRAEIAEVVAPLEAEDILPVGAASRRDGGARREVEPSVCAPSSPVLPVVHAQLVDAEVMQAEAQILDPMAPVDAKLIIPVAGVPVEAQELPREVDTELVESPASIAAGLILPVVATAVEGEEIVCEAQLISTEVVQVEAEIVQSQAPEEAELILPVVATAVEAEELDREDEVTVFETSSPVSPSLVLPVVQTLLDGAEAHEIGREGVATVLKASSPVIPLLIVPVTEVKAEKLDREFTAVVVDASSAVVPSGVLAAIEKLVMVTIEPAAASVDAVKLPAVNSHPHTPDQSGPASATENPPIPFPVSFHMRFPHTTLCSATAAGKASARIAWPIRSGKLDTSRSPAPSFEKSTATSVSAFHLTTSARVESADSVDLKATPAYWR